MKLNPKTGYSAVAAAVAVACGAAYAAVPAGTGVSQIFSAEGNAAAKATAVFSAPVTVTLESDYIVNDTVELAVTGATFIAGTSTLSPAGANAGVTCGSSVTLGFLSRSTTSANYRVTGASGGNGATCSFSLPLSRNSLGTAGTVPTVSFTAKTAQSGLVFDAAAVVATLGSVRAQFVAPSSITVLNGVVDVEKGRYQFATSDASTLLSATGTNDTLTFTLNNNAGSASSWDATLTSVVGVINGDFSFADGGNTTAGCQNSDLTSGLGRIAASGATLSINSACSQLTFTATAAGAVTIALGTSGPGITAPTNGSILDAPQEFTVDALTYNYAGQDGGSTATKSVAFSATGSGGEWTLNGLLSKVSYMPYGDGISRIVYITNRSAQTGGVSATAIDDKGKECEIPSVATATKGTVTLLSAGLDAGIKACFGEGYSGRVAFDITANIPADDAEIYSAYNVNGNRVLVVNDTNGK